jgi:hypothetical protein
MTDTYTKIILKVIAACLVAIVVLSQRTQQDVAQMQVLH